MNKFITCRKLSKSYQKGKVTIEALQEINLDITRGEYMSILGPSGSGKSTLMNILGCFDIPTSGSYIFDQQEISDLTPNELAAIRNKKIGFVFQSFHLLPHATALENT